MILTGKAVKFAGELEKVIAKHGIERRELNEEEQQHFLALTTLYQADRAFSLFIDFATHLYAECVVSGNTKQLELANAMNEVITKLFG